MEYLLGIDIGTTGCKVSIYDKEAKQYGSSYRNYVILSEQQGYAEENPDEWWVKLTEALQDCLYSSKVPSNKIAAVGISGTNGVIAVDSKGHCLTNAIMQIDGRSTIQADFLEETIGKEAIMEITGNRVAPSNFSAPIILWLKEHKRESYNKTYKFLSPTGFIVQRLTGAFTMDHTRASTSLLYDIKKKKWSDTIFDLLDLDMKKLPDIFYSDEIVGYVSDEVSRVTGLTKGLPVVAGAMDSVAACIGIGCIQTDQPTLVLGTVARMCIPLKKDIFYDAFLNVAFTKEVPYLAMTPVNGGGLSARWFMENFCKDDERLAKEKGISIYSQLEEEAERIPSGSDSLIYLPYLAGERSPIWDTKARGMFFGISYKHTKYHFYRAVMEGVAYAIRHNIEIFQKNSGEEIATIYMCGGGAKSNLWRNIFADVLSKSIAIPDTIESETKGSAFLAGIGIGLYSSIAQAKELSKTELIVQPEAGNKNRYDLLYDVYKNLYPHCKNDYTELYNI